MTRPPVEPSSSSGGPAWTASDLEGNPHEARDKPERVRRMFASIARRYDLNNRLHSFGRDQGWRRRAVELAGIAASDRVLDVACGTGDLTEAIWEAGPAEVIGVDFTPEMLELARLKRDRRRRPARPGAPAPPEYLQGDAMDLAFEAGRFEVVTIAFGLRNVADPARALAEFRRVLAPGGRLVVLEFSEPSNPILRFGNRVYTKRIMPVTATLIARDRSGAYRYLPRSVATFPEGSALRESISAAGFSDVEEHRLTFGVCTAWRGLRGPDIGPGIGPDAPDSATPGVSDSYNRRL